MKLGIMQPYFFPYLGYYQLINFVDKYIIYDDVNYIKSGWINRNYILLNGKRQLITLPLKKASSFKLISQIQAGDQVKKLLKTIYQAYIKAPYFDAIFPMLEKLLTSKSENLALFLSETIKFIAGFLDISTDIKLSSDIRKDSKLKGEEKILHICELAGADHYINAIGGIELYSKQKFMERNIKLDFLKTKTICYKQFNNPFIPNLSIIDVLMFNSKQDVVAYLDKFELV